MQKRLFIIISGNFLSISLLTACKKESILVDCASLENTEITSDKESNCVYYDVYQYNNETFTVTSHCLIDIVYMAYNCEGEELCDYTEDCMIDFAANAEYLYAVKPKE